MVVNFAVGQMVKSLRCARPGWCLVALAVPAMFLLGGCSSNVRPVQIDASASCNRSSDCPSGTGVCREQRCTTVECSDTNPCLAGERCAQGTCAPSIVAPPGQTAAASGGVSTSSKYIHIGITGQGRAVGASSSGQYQQVTGAASIMRR